MHYFLGWSGGGFIGVGDTYLFLTIAAVVVGGTSLLGGYGGYGLSVIGVLILQVITTGTSWLGFKMGSATVYIRFINYTNGCLIC